MAVADEAAIESDPELDFGPGPGLALTGRLGTSDDELDEPVPNAERLVAQAVALAGEDHDHRVAGRPVLAVRAGRGAGRLHRRGDARGRAAATASWPAAGCPAS